MKVIGIFKGSCPSGWTRVSAWDDKFLMGSSTYNLTGGGSTDHRHTVDLPPYYTSHLNRNLEPDVGIGSPKRYYVPSEHVHTLDVPSGNSLYTDNIPECIDVVFCSYQEN
jgi:hypothetical protein